MAQQAKKPVGRRGERKQATEKESKRAAHASGAQVDAASYIADMSRQLANLAHESNMAFLSYLLELAVEEASAQARKHWGRS